MILSSPITNSAIWVSISLLSFLWVSLFLLNSATTMKVHPIPKKRNITFRYNTTALSEANRIMGRQKKLRRLPHIFNKVLELPFHSDADVTIEENPDHFRFVATTDAVGNDIRTQTIEIYPGVTKIVLRGSNVLELNLDEFELDLWRFRLPPATKPELASAVYVDGELIVTVPKDLNVVEEGDDDEEDGVWGGGNGDGLRGGGVSRLVLVQYQSSDLVRIRQRERRVLNLKSESELYF